MKTSDQIDLIASALASMQAELEPAIKDAVNPAFRSHYATLTSMREAARAPMGKNGLVLLQEPIRLDTGLGLITRLLHKSGQWIEFEPLPIPVDKANAHGVASAVTYGRRISMGAVLGMVTDEDDDGNGAVKATPERQPSSPAPSHPAPPMPSSGTVSFTSAILAAKQDGEGKQKNGTPWTRYAITFANNDVAKTFDEKVYQAASVVAGTGEMVIAEIEHTDRGAKLVSVKPHSGAAF